MHFGYRVSTGITRPRFPARVITESDWFHGAWPPWCKFARPRCFAIRLTQERWVRWRAIDKAERSMEIRRRIFATAAVLSEHTTYVVSHNEPAINRDRGEISVAAGCAGIFSTSGAAPGRSAGKCLQRGSLAWLIRKRSGRSLSLRDFHEPRICRRASRNKERFLYTGCPASTALFL